MEEANPQRVVNNLKNIDDRFAYEYDSLVVGKQYPTDQIEVFIEANNVVKFLIKLEVNLPMVSDSPDDYLVALLVRFAAMMNGRPVKLLSSINVAEAFGENLELFRNIKSDESVADYAEEVARNIEEGARKVVMSRQQKRKQLIFELLKRFGQSVVSYDALEYHRASLLLNSNWFVCVLEVELPLHFPHQPPLYRLLSVYSTSSEAPLSQRLDKIPYSETWNIGTMVGQALDFIVLKKIPAFQNVCVQRFQSTLVG